MGFSSGWNPDVSLFPDATVSTTPAVIRANMPRWLIASNTQTATTSGTLRAQAITLPAGFPVTQLGWYAGTTAGSSLTHQWFGLYTGAAGGGKLATTADDISTGWSASVTKQLFVSRRVADAVITAGGGSPADKTVTSATIAFTSADVGKAVTFVGAGAAGVPLGTSAAPVLISTVTNATTAVLDTSCSTTVAANGEFFVATPYTTLTSGLFYIVHLITHSAGAVPTLSGYNSIAAVAGLVPKLGGSTADTGLTTVATAPATIGAITNNGNIAYVYAL